MGMPKLARILNLWRTASYCQLYANEVQRQAIGKIL